MTKPSMMDLFESTKIGLILHCKYQCMEDFQNHCFVCGIKTDGQNSQINQQLNLPVCNKCKDTEEETRVAQELREGMADGFVCGCI